MQKKHIIPIVLFLAVEAILYYLLLAYGGQIRVYTSFGAIVLCFAFALLMGRKYNPLIVAGLACTVGADFCLVMCNPIEQLAGMAFFLGTQIHYATLMHKRHKSPLLLWIRIALSVFSVIVAAIVLKENLDALAIFSIAYYANLIMNMIVAFTQWKTCRLLPIAFVLFLLCDTVIGLQVAANGYLPIKEGSWLHNIIFTDFYLSWFFYLPSQVLIALSSMRKGDANGCTETETV